MVANAYMNNRTLRHHIKQIADKLHEDELGFWKFDYQDSLVFVMTDESHNRMRIMAPVADSQSLDEDALRVLMTANYDRALDARYCINEGTLWSAFIHPLRELGDTQFHNGLTQVVTLSKNFGTTFSSGELVFGG